MADVPQLGPNPGTSKTRSTQGGAPLLAVADPVGFIGEVRHFAAEAFRAISALELSTGKPYVKPTPFAITYILPHALGGIVPNESFGLSPDLGITAIPQAIIVPGGAGINAETQRLYYLQQQIEREENVRQAAPGWDTERLEQALFLARGRAAGNRVQADVTVAFLEKEILRRQLANPFLGPVIVGSGLYPGIESRGVLVPNPAGVTWPESGALASVPVGVGFIDQLAAFFPPDP